MCFKKQKNKNLKANAVTFRRSKFCEDGVSWGDGPNRYTESNMKSISLV